MGTLLGTLLAFGIVFGVLVFIHEFGHFIMAKLMRIKVEVFSWGYGKRLLGIKKGDTDYRISIFPLGGFVKFSGEEVFEEKRKLAPYDFLAKKRWQRFLVILLGPVMNVFLAIFLYSVINMVGVQIAAYQEKKPVIGWIEPGSPAERAGLQVGDEVLTVNNRKTKTWNDVEIAVGTKPERLIKIEVKRRQRVKTFELMTEKKTRYDMGYAGFYGKILTQVNMVNPNSPAERGGLKPGDVILKINGEPVFYFQFVKIIEANANRELEFLVDREGKQIVLHLTPRLEGKVGKIGIIQTPRSVLKRYGFFTAIFKSLEQCWDLTSLLFDYLKDLVTGKASVRQLGGPIAIANISYAALRMGFLALISFIALISLQLGLINLFPIPVLDGGHLLVLALEGILRRDFSPKVKQAVMQVGFVIFIILIVFALLNDISRTLPRGWKSIIPW
ncbi:MAG: RIP metalloprotease RseP [Candidatus Aminicenantales bacterium]